MPLFPIFRAEFRQPGKWNNCDFCSYFTSILSAMTPPPFFSLPSSPVLFPLIHFCLYLSSSFHPSTCLHFWLVFAAVSISHPSYPPSLYIFLLKTGGRNRTKSMWENVLKNQLCRFQLKKDSDSWTHNNIEFCPEITKAAIRVMLIPPHTHTLALFLEKKVREGRAWKINWFKNEKDRVRGKKGRAKRWTEWKMCWFVSMGWMSQGTLAGIHHERQIILHLYSSSPFFCVCVRGYTSWLQT